MDCQVCFLPYDTSSRKPKSLPCGHSYCAECLAKLLDESTSIIVCPKDRTGCLVPNKKIEELPTCFALLDLLPDDCVDCHEKPQDGPCLPEHCSMMLCSDCKTSHLKKFSTELVDELQAMKKQVSEQQAMCDNNNDFIRMLVQSQTAIAVVSQIFDAEKEKIIDAIRRQQEISSNNYFQWKKNVNLCLAQARSFLNKVLSEGDIQSGKILSDLKKQIIHEKNAISPVEPMKNQLPLFDASEVQQVFDRMMPALYDSLKPIIPDYTAAGFSQSYGKSGSGAGEFNNPWGVASSPVTGQAVDSITEQQGVHNGRAAAARSMYNVRQTKQNTYDSKLNIPQDVQGEKLTRKGIAQTTYQRKAKGPLLIAECDPSGRYIVVQNTGRREEDISRWGIRRNVDGRDVIPYRFPDYSLRPAGRVKIFGKASRHEAGPNDFVADFQSWDVGENIITELVNPSNEFPSDSNLNVPQNVQGKKLTGKGIAQTTCQRGAKGPLSIAECEVSGRYIAVQNTGRREEDISGWGIRRNVDGREVIPFRFPDYSLRPAGRVKIFGNASRHEAGPNDFVADFQSWDVGDNIITELVNPSNENVQGKKLTRKGIAQTTCQRGAKEPLSIAECELSGRYIAVQNTGRREEDISGWGIRRNVDDREAIPFRFPDYSLRAGGKVKIFGKASRHEAGPNDLVADFQSWDVGDNIIIELVNPSNEERAKHIQRTIYS